MVLYVPVRSCMVPYSPPWFRMVPQGPEWTHIVPFGPACSGMVPYAGVHKTGIRGIQDTRQIVDGKTNDFENNNKNGGSKVQTLNCPVINVKLYKQDQIPF